MEKDLAAFAETISRLKYSHDEPDLNQRIEQAEPTAKKSDTFLIKMEIKRLSQPIKRNLDIRNITKSKCQPVEKAGLTHFLDTDTEVDLDKELKGYKGLYTQGVFESVLANAKARYRDTDNNQKNNPIPVPKHLILNRFFQRKDERLYFASKIFFYYSDPTQIKKQERSSHRHEGMTTDISENGLRLKVDSKDIKPLNKIFVQFFGLEQEFSLDGELFVSYDLLRKDIDGSKSTMIVTLDHSQPEANKKGCKLLIKKCIHTQRRRNRISVENTEEAVNLKIHEQFVNSNMNCLPILLVNQSNMWIPRAVLFNTSNSEMKAFMQHPSGGFMLPRVFSNQLIQDKFAAEDEFVSTLFILRFRDKNKALNFAMFRFDQAIVDPAIKALLVKGLKQGSVRLYRVHACKVDSAENYHVSSSLPDSAGEAFANLNRVPSDKLTRMMSMFQRMCVISDITPSAAMLGFDDDGSDANAPPVNIRSYLLDTSKAVGKVVQCHVETEDNRLEDRFDLQFKVRVGKRKRDSDIQAKGVTVNACSRGLLVDIENAVPLTVGEDISVDLKLDFVEPPIAIENQKYKIVGKEGNRMRLAVSGDIATHEGRIALRENILDNLDSIKAVGVSEPVYGFSKAVRNVFSSNHINLRGLTSRVKGTQFISSIMRSPKTPDLILHPDLSQADGLDMLCTNTAFRKMVFDALGGMNEDELTTTFHLIVVARKKRQDAPLNLLFREITSEMDCNEMKFTYASFKSFGTPLLLRINLSKKGEVFDKYFRDELRYLVRYARAKHQQITQDMENVTAIMEIQNLTDLAQLLEPDDNDEPVLI